MTKKKEAQPSPEVAMVEATIHLKYPASHSLGWALGTVGRQPKVAEDPEARAFRQFAQAMDDAARRLGLADLPTQVAEVPSWLEAVTSKARKGVR